MGEKKQIEQADKFLWHPKNREMLIMYEHLPKSNRIKFRIQNLYFPQNKNKKDFLLNQLNQINVLYNLK